MISLEEVEKDILELEARDTSFVNCQRLSVLYTVRNNLRSYQAKAPLALDVSGESEFLRAVNGKNADKMWKILDELMEVLQVMNPRLYDGVMRKINE